VALERHRLSWRRLPAFIGRHARTGGLRAVAVRAVPVPGRLNRWSPASGLSRMTFIEKTITIHAAPEDVWELAGDPGRIGEWLPAFAEATLEGDERTCVTGDGGTIRERILERDDDERFYVYEITESPLPVASYRSRLDVDGHGDHPHVTWTSEFEVTDPAPEDEVAAAIGQLYEDGLEGLRAHLEA